MIEEVRMSGAGGPAPPASRLLLVVLALFIAHNLFGAWTMFRLVDFPSPMLTGSGLKLAGLVLLSVGLLARVEGRFVLRPRRPVLGIATAVYVAGLFVGGLGPAPFAGVVLLGSYPFAVPALIAWQDLRRTEGRTDSPPAPKPLSVEPRGYLASVAVGLVVGTTVPVFTALAGGAVPEWIPQLTWLGLAILGSAGLGYLFPIGATRWALIVMAVQPLCVLGALLFSGEIQNPSSSTGGGAAVFIIAGFCLILSPFAILGGRFGASLKEKALYGTRQAPEEWAPGAEGPDD